ncbi:MAG: hypothetical protein ACJAZO_004470, partial [Myxococcota bacterium]
MTDEETQAPSGMWRWFKRIGAGAAVTGLLGVTLIGGGIWYWR